MSAVGEALSASYDEAGRDGPLFEHVVRASDVLSGAQRFKRQTSAPFPSATRADEARARSMFVTGGAGRLNDP